MIYLPIAFIVCALALSTAVLAEDLRYVNFDASSEKFVHPLLFFSFSRFRSSPQTPPSSPLHVC